MQIVSRETLQKTDSTSPKKLFTRTLVFLKVKEHPCQQVLMLL